MFKIITFDANSSYFISFLQAFSWLCKLVFSLSMRVVRDFKFMLTLKMRIPSFAQKSLSFSILQSPFNFQHTHTLLLGHANPNGPKFWDFNLFLCFIKFLWRFISLWQVVVQNNYMYVDSI